MKIRELFDRQTVRSLLGYIFLLTTFVVSGCAYAPTAIPTWAVDKLDIPLARVYYGSLNPTVIQTAPPGAHAVRIMYLPKGKLIWGEGRLGDTAVKGRFALYGPGKDGETTICELDWQKEPLQASDKIEVPCDFKSPEKLASFYGLPLRIALTFLYQDESPSEYPDPDRVVESSFYILSDSKVCKEIDDKFKCVNVKK